MVGIESAVAPGSELGTSTWCLACGKTFPKSIWQHLLVPLGCLSGGNIVYIHVPQYQNYGCLVSGYYSALFGVQIASSCDRLLLEYYCLLTMNSRMYLQAVSVGDIGGFGSPCTLSIPFSVGSLNSG